MRDYILVLFSKDTVIKFDQISIDAKLKGHIKEFLNVFAVERPSMKDWKFKNQTDVSFMTSIMKTYPDIVQKQQKLIAEIEKKVAAVINRAVRAGPGAKNAKPSTSTMSNSGNGASALVTGNRAMSNETRETLRKALSKFILNHKICRYFACLLFYIFCRFHSVQVYHVCLYYMLPVIQFLFTA